MLTKISKHKEKEVIGELRKFLNEELCNSVFLQQMKLQNLSFSWFVNVDCILFGGRTITQTKEKYSRRRQN